MSENKRYLVVDAGNTRIKAAVFNGEKILEIHHFSNTELQQLKSFLIDVRYHGAILSSVRSPKETQWMLQLMPGAKLFRIHAKLPIQLDYETPETLGADRLANAIAAFHQSRGNCLVIDVGTCVKFDLVDLNGHYQGGSISPGIQLRYKSMNSFTAALPLINITKPAKLIGKSTVECMHSGVIGGIQAEINQFIQNYNTVYQDLSVFVTGGDAQHFDFESKNSIFVNENLTLLGLYITLKEHAY